jgi:enamine deaminase RidA (YjgF/YER057c/UK114 family)
MPAIRKVNVGGVARLPDVAVFGAEPPARITVGCTALALGALVEMDCVAFRPDDARDPGDMP